MSKEPFPWTVFSANTLRPMIADILRSGGYTGIQLNKESSLALLQKIEKQGLKAALEELPSNKVGTSASTSKRKQEVPNEAEAEVDPDSSEPARKRGRASRKAASASAEVPAPSASRTRNSRHSDPGEGLLTRRQSAAVRGEKVPPTRSWKPAPRSPRKLAPKAARVLRTSVSAPLPTPKPKSKGRVFDGVELVKVKRPASYVGKGKARETDDTDANGVEGEEDDECDDDAEGELIDDHIVEVDTFSLENSNKENEQSLFEIANADTTDEDIIPAEVIGSPAPQITIEPTDDQIEEARNHDISIEIGSPAPQITIEPTDDQIEEARNHDVSIEIGSPAPEIHIEPTADGDMEQIEENGHNDIGGGLLQPRVHIDTRARSVELNPEYSIEVLSPTSAQHDSDDEMWVAGGVNGDGEGLQAAGGGLTRLDALD